MIIFGTKGRDDARGFIADGCPACQQIRAFAVIDQYEVPHVYRVSIGKGSLRGSHMRCVHCAGTFAFDANKYRDIMSCAEADHSNLSELVRRTHPQLAGHLDQPAGCQGCGHRRDRPFKFCPQCGLRTSRP